MLPSEINAAVEALKIEPRQRGLAQTKILKQFTHSHVPIMEPMYCTNDDYTFIQERLKYRFVKKGHFAVRQGQPGSEVFFLVQGSVDVL